MSEMELQTGEFAPVVRCGMCAIVVCCALITGCGGVHAGGERSAVNPTDHSAAASTDNYQYEQWRWRNGDIVYVYNGHADHMGMIDAGVSASDNSPDVIDANTLGVVRRHNDFDKWADQGEWKNIEGYYVRAPVHAFDWEQMALDAGNSNADGCQSEKVSSYRQDSKLRCAEGSVANRQYSSANKFNTGAVYNAQSEIDTARSLFQRNSPDNTHSSQLIWRVYKYIYEVDLDSDGGWWTWPKDIREHRDVRAIPGAFSTLP